MSKYTFLKIITTIITVSIVVYISFNLDLKTSSNYTDIKTISMIIGILVLWPAFKIIEHYEKKSKH